MGFAIAQAAVEKGANVTLIAGPVHLNISLKVRRSIDVMYYFRYERSCYE